MEHSLCDGPDACDCACHSEDDSCCESCEGFCFCQCHICLDCHAPDGLCYGASDCECECHDCCEDCSTGDDDEDDYDDYADYDQEDNDDETAAEKDKDWHQEANSDEDQARPGGEQLEGDRGDFQRGQQDKLAKVVERIRHASGYSFEVEKERTIDGNPMQAVAKDGKVVITEAMVENLSEDELAWVIGHEVAHLEHDDAARREAVSQELSAKTDELLAKLDRDLEKGGHGLFARISAQVIGGVVTGAARVGRESFDSRKREEEADRRATKLTENAGLKPEAGVEALRKIHGGHFGHHTFFGGLVASHPSSTTRAEAIEREIEKKRKK